MLRKSMVNGHEGVERDAVKTLRDLVWRVLDGQDKGGPPVAVLVLVLCRGAFVWA